MIIKNLGYEMISRFTQDDDYMDTEIDMLSSASVITAGIAFNTELIHNILLGLTTLTSPNYTVKYLDSADVTYVSSSAVSDFYETENALISETILINSLILTEDIYLIQGEILYNRGGGQDALSVLTSTELQSNSQFSAYVNESSSTLKALKVDLAGGDLTITTIFRFVIGK